jgi:nitroreductase
MELDEVIRTRRSIRRYAPRPVDDELIRKCVEAACHAPSAHNSQPWKFVIVKQREKIHALSHTQPYSAFLRGAPAVIVALADPAKSPNHWLEDVSCAIMLLLLKVHELGLGACWNAVYHPQHQRREEYVRRLLDIPTRFRVIANIGIGYPAEKPEPHSVKSFEEATSLE